MLPVSYCATPQSMKQSAFKKMGFNANYKVEMFLKQTCRCFSSVGLPNALNNNNASIDAGNAITRGSTIAHLVPAAKESTPKRALQSRSGLDSLIWMKKSQKRLTAVPVAKLA